MKSPALLLPLLPLLVLPLVCLVPSCNVIQAVFGGTSYIKPPTEEPSQAEASDAYARVLQQFVDDRGLLDFAGMKKEPKDLGTYVAWVARHSPKSTPALFPTRQDQLAFYLNSYNALAMYNVTNSTTLPEDKVGFFYTNALQVGGEYMSLYDYENKVIRPLDDERAHFALNCMVRGCPRLPRVPFTGEQLEAQLDAAAKLFFNEARNVEIDQENQQVRFNQILDFYTGDFLKKAKSLIEYANRYRVPPIPADLSVDFIPYDWTLNSQDGPGG